MNASNWLWIGLNTVLLVTGQFLWKYGMMHRSFEPDVLSIIKLLLSPWILLGLIIYGAATVVWLFILSRVPLSIAYPLQSTAYVLAVVGAYVLFGEPLSWVKIAGVILIMLGVSLIGVSAA
ncbi:EamA family transporter [Geobacillus stearothermophilus]|jgi:multidrug transporter EmrE-like cation transporter|uniref:EamA family transporter n=1 Tax=Geobacillus stearothermophilus TaxID=1422 RepID=UPI000BB166BD|nr:hypothetical protein GS458_3037 [Geobacillus stearothermophilus]MED4301251.1 EamA family transporter [Geobacillus stearothermophilus]